jgi:hypothetical protein
MHVVRELCQMLATRGFSRAWIDPMIEYAR